MRARESLQVRLRGTPTQKHGGHLMGVIEGTEQISSISGNEGVDFSRRHGLPCSGRQGRKQEPFDGGADGVGLALKRGSHF